MKHSSVARLPCCLPLRPLPACLLSADVACARGAAETRRRRTLTAERQHAIPVLLEVHGWEAWGFGLLWSSALSEGSGEQELN